MKTRTAIRPCVVQIYTNSIVRPRRGPIGRLRERLESVAFNWIIIAATKTVNSTDIALTLSKMMLKTLYSMIVEGKYTPKIKFIKDFDKSRVSYDETEDGEIGFIRYHYSDDWSKYTEEDDEFYDDAEIIFQSTYMDLLPFKDCLKDGKYEYFEAYETDYEFTSVGSFFISYFDGQYYAITCNDWKDGVIGRSDTLDGSLIELEKYLAKEFEIPECIYFDYDKKENKVWISKKEQ